MTQSKRDGVGSAVAAPEGLDDAAAGVGPDASDARALLEALRAVARELRLTEQRERPQLGLPPAQLRVLRELSTRPADSLGELAARTYTDPSSASVVVQRLVERGLVERVESEVDRRRTALAASAEGRAFVARAPADAVARVADAILPLGEEQVALLAQGLRVLARELRGEHDAGAGREHAPADLPAVADRRPTSVAS